MTFVLQPTGDSGIQEAVITDSFGDELEVTHARGFVVFTINDRAVSVMGDDLHALLAIIHLAVGR